MSDRESERPKANDRLTDQRRQAEESIVLVFDETGPIWKHLSAYMESDGRLVLAGHDLGPKASLLGDEWEYWIYVSSDDLNPLRIKLAEAVGVADGDHRELLTLLKRAFDTGVFSSSLDFHGWLESHDLPFKFESWTSAF